MSTTDEVSQVPARVIGPAGAIAIVAGSMLGIGIFLTPRIVADLVETPFLYVLAWVLGGGIAVAGAVAYAELGTMFPKPGGDYVFLREAFGSSVAFASGWLLFAGVFAGSIATMAVPVWQYQLPALLAPWGVLDAQATLVGGLSVAQVGAIALILALTAVSHLGTRLATGVQVVLTMVPFALLALGAVALLVVQGTGALTTPAPLDDAPGALEGLVRANLAIYFAYAGWNAIGYVGGEVRNPGRTIPLGLLGGTAAILLLYGLLSAAFLSVLGLDGLRGAFEAGTATAAAAGGGTATWFVTLLIALALFGSLNGTVLTGARIAVAMAHDGAISRSVGTTSRRFGTPAVALWVQAGLACVLVATGTFERLLDLTGVAMLAMGAMTVVALFVLRRQRPDLPRPYRATFYPFLPALYLVASAAVVFTKVADAVAPRPGTSLGESLFPLYGVGVFAIAWAAHAGLRRARGKGEVGA